MQKEIEGFSGYYITDLGDVVTTNYKKGHETIVMKPQVSNSGYLHVTLTNKGKVKTVYIHRLVAQAFLPNPEGKAYVNHIDFNKLNNRVTNLEWTTPEENCDHFRNADNSQKNTSGRRGVLYKDGNKVGSFRSLNQAKIFCLEHYGCSLCTIGERNVNVSHNIVFIREGTKDTISDFLEKEQKRAEALSEELIKRIKSEKGICGYVISEDGEKLFFNSVREAEASLNVSFKKKEDGIYKAKRYTFLAKSKM